MGGQSRGWALVTGGARRIGAALALAAGRSGYDVLVHGRTPDSDPPVMAAIEALGRRARLVAADLADPESPKRLAEAAAPLTLLVNSASEFGDDRIDTLDPAALRRRLEVNLVAPVLLAQAFAAALPSEREGLIVNIVDQRVLRLTPQFFGYTLSRAALWAATQTLAQALAPRIRVNAIGPGPTLPSQAQGEAAFLAEAAATPLGRAVDPAEIGAALAFLIEARSVTGQLLCVDAGQHLSWRTPDVVDY